jgi:hypothetical protein
LTFLGLIKLFRSIVAISVVNILIAYE